MSTKSSENPILRGFILDYAENKLTRPELASFTEVMACTPEIRIPAKRSRAIRQMLGRLPRIKARDGFEQRMAARFALELERETVKSNARRQNGKAELTAT
jgi:hypothetical protein